MELPNYPHSHHLVPQNSFATKLHYLKSQITTLKVRALLLAFTPLFIACKKDNDQPLQEVVRLSFDRRIPHGDHYHSEQKPTVVSYDANGNSNKQSIELIQGQRYQLTIDFYENGIVATQSDFLNGPIDDIKNRIFLLFAPEGINFHSSSTTAYQRLKEWRTGLKSEFTASKTGYFDLNVVVQRDLDISLIENSYLLNDINYQQEFGGITQYRLPLRINSVEKDVDDSNLDFGH